MKCLILIGCAGILPAAAQIADVRLCTAAMLNGTYVLSISGTRPAPRVLAGLNGTPGTPEAVTGLFLQTFDGIGSFVQPGIVTVKGALSGLFPDQPGSGPYQVASDCTGSFTVNLPQLPTPLEVRMIVLDGGERFKAVVVAPQPLMIAVEGTRIVSRSPGGWNR